MFEKEKKKEENWVEKQDRRNEVKTDIAILFFAASVIAGVFLAPHIINPSLFTDSDVWLLLFVVVTFFVGFWLQLSANFLDNPHIHSVPWWWWVND